MSHSISAGESYGKRVLNAENGKKIGKLRNVLLHPKEKRVVGFSVKRPDILLMAHRKDAYVGIDDFSLEEGVFYAHAFSTSPRQIVPVQKSAVADKESTKKSLAKRENISWKDCIVWYGLAVLTEDGERLGSVGDVSFDSETGMVEQIEIATSIGSDALLGRACVEVSDIISFKRGVGEQLLDEDGFEVGLGALVVSNKAAQVQLQDLEGGLAEKAGSAAAIVGDKASEAKEMVVDKVSTNVKPTLDKAAQKASEVANEASTKGAYKLGEQLGKSTGMFSAFIDEYKKANKDE